MKWFLAILFVFVAGIAGAFQSIVILPFSNGSAKDELFWLGEGFAESLGEELLLKDALVIGRPQRKAAYEDLRLPYTGGLSRATMLKIADKVSADFVVFGTYSVKDSKVQVELKVIRLGTSELSEPIRAAGNLDSLNQVQIALRDGLFKYFQSRNVVPVSDTPFVNKEIPLGSYEQYIKGLLEDSDANRIKFFQRALEGDPGYEQASFRLGQTLAQLQRYKESSDALSKNAFQSPYREKADFMIALNAFKSSDLETAYQKWLDLSKIRPTAEVYNNIGVSLMLKGDPQGAGWYLSKATEFSPAAADFHFNLAGSYVQRGYDKQAVQQYREALRLSPGDFQVVYLIAKILERDADPALSGMVSKRVMDLFQGMLPTEQKGKFPESYTSVNQLLRTSPALLSLEDRQYTDLLASRKAKERTEFVKTYQTAASGDVEKEDPASAVIEIKKGTSLDPFNWFLHYLWGRSLLAQNNRDDAVAELQFASWCQDNIESHLLLAEIYRDTERYADSKLQIQRSLALDPENKHALDIWNKIWDKQ